jgi:S1-C subfamily serine protease
MSHSAGGRSAGGWFPGTGPFDSLEGGRTPEFRGVAFTGTVPEGVATVDNWQFFDGMVIAIGFHDGTTTTVMGSGVLVAPGVAISAAHVMKDYWERLAAGGIAPICFGIKADEGLQFWNVRKVSYIPETDIAVLVVELASALPSDNTINQALITTRTPVVGETVTIFGFRAGNESFDLEEGRLKISAHLWAARGPVGTTHPEGRDPGMIPWPCFEVGVFCHGGMSGGPVFDKDGLLIGILTSSFDCGDGGGFSYVSLIWRGLVTQVEATWPPGMHGEPITLLEMPSCLIDNRTCIELARNDDGSSAMSYLPWS